MEADGNTNTHEALKQALDHEEADTFYLLSDGEPSMDMRTILLDLKVCLQQRRNPCMIHAIAFLMGHTSNDPKPREFMAQIAIMGGGVFRCMDPFTPVHREFGGDLYTDNPNFNDDEFVQFFQGRLRDVPQQLLQNFGFSPPPFAGNNPYQRSTPYPPVQQQYPPSQMAPANSPYQSQTPYPPVQQQNPSPQMAPANGPYQSQTPYPPVQQQYPPPQMAPPNAPYQKQTPYHPVQQQNPSSTMGSANNLYQKQHSYSSQESRLYNLKSELKSRPRFEGEIDIPSFHHEDGHDRFNIRLNIRQIISGKDGQWSLSHTFDELKQLHHQLEKRCSLPIFRSDHHSLLHSSKQNHEQRRQELQTYLKQLYVYVSPYDHREFDFFLLMELHINKIIQQAEIQWKASVPSQGELPPYGSWKK